MKKIAARTEVADALERLGKLTQDIIATNVQNSYPPTATAVSARNSNTARQQLRVEIRRWLSPSDPSINYNVAREARHEETAQWFLQSKNYTEWKSTGTGTLLWVHGKRVFVFFAFTVWVLIASSRLPSGLWKECPLVRHF